MGLDNTLYTLSNINALLGSTVGFTNARNNGVPVGDALMDFGFNVMNGAIRNEAARDIRRHTGSYLGYAFDYSQGDKVKQFLHRMNSLPDNATDFNH